MTEHRELAHIKPAVKDPVHRQDPIHRRISRSNRPLRPENKIITLQKMIGNQAVLRLARSGRLQAKLKVSQPGDEYEREADRVADTVMRMPEPGVMGNSLSTPEGLLQRKCRNGGKCPLLRDDEPVRRKASSPAATEAPGAVIDPGQGRPLDAQTRSFMEPRFGRDFSGVRVYDGPKAAESARAIDAVAYTAGRDIVFGTGQYLPHSAGGRRLLAHELAHVVQQSPGSIGPRLFRWAHAQAPQQTYTPNVPLTQNLPVCPPRPPPATFQAPAPAITTPRPAAPAPAVAPTQTTAPARPAMGTNLTLGQATGLTGAAIGLGVASSILSRFENQQFRDMMHRDLQRWEDNISRRSPEIINRLRPHFPEAEALARANPGRTVYFNFTVRCEMQDVIQPDWPAVTSVTSYNGTFYERTEVSLEARARTWEETRTAYFPPGSYREFYATYSIPYEQADVSNYHAMVEAMALGGECREPSERGRCQVTPMPPRGGNVEHDALAAHVTGSPVEYLINTGGAAYQYDGMDPIGTLYEVKTRHEFLRILNLTELPRWTPGQTMAISGSVADLRTEITLAKYIADVCGYDFHMAVNDLEVCLIMREILGDIINPIKIEWVTI